MALSGEIRAKHFFSILLDQSTALQPLSGQWRAPSGQSLAFLGVGEVSGPVRLADFLSVDRVSVGFRADDKAAALSGVASLFDDLSRGGASVPRTLELLQEREALASTGVGSGVAIPHARIPEVPATVGAVAVAPSGVDFEAIDGEPVFVLVCLLAPRRAGPGSSDHLRALARISRVLRDPAVRDGVRRAELPADVLDILVAADEQSTSA